MTRDLATLRAMINATVPSRASAIAIHVGEWNFSADPGTLGQYAYTGFASVLDADLLGLILSRRRRQPRLGKQERLAEPAVRGGVPGGDPVTAPCLAVTSQTRPCRCTRRSACSPARACSPGSAPRSCQPSRCGPGIDAFASADPDEIVLGQHQRQGPSGWTVRAERGDSPPAGGRGSGSSTTTVPTPGRPEARRSQAIGAASDHRTATEAGRGSAPSTAECVAAAPAGPGRSRGARDYGASDRPPATSTEQQVIRQFLPSSHPTCL